MRTYLLLLLALLATACAQGPAPAPAAAARMTRDTGSDRVAVYTPGTRAVRVLLVRPPSIVLLREVFVPADAAITGVRWSGADLLIDTTDERLALDTRTWTLAARAASAGATASARGRRRG